MYMILDKFITEPIFPNEFSRGLMPIEALQSRDPPKNVSPDRAVYVTLPHEPKGRTFRRSIAIRACPTDDRTE